MSSESALPNPVCPIIQDLMATEGLARLRMRPALGIAAAALDQELGSYAHAADLWAEAPAGVDESRETQIRQLGDTAARQALTRQKYIETYDTNSLIAASAARDTEQHIAFHHRHGGCMRPRTEASPRTDELYSRFNSWWRRRSTGESGE